MTHQSTKLALPVGVAMDRFIKRKQEDFPYASGELSQLLRDIALAAKVINGEIRRSGLSGIEGPYGTNNIHGESQQKLDVIANIRFQRALENGGEVSAIISEEEDEVINLNCPNGKYIVAIDPLDGSSNIDVNVSIGTIFSIYRRETTLGSDVKDEDFMQPGRSQVAAGYILYGSSTMLIYTTGRGVNGFTYEPSLGEFFLSHPDIVMPETGKIYSVNEGYFDLFEESDRQYIRECREKSFTARYIGSLVADFHRNLMKGGIYMYPATKTAPSGKLRLLYECNALAFIAEQAGGLSTDGYQQTLDINPSSLHQRAPLYIGSKKLVEELMTHK